MGITVDWDNPEKTIIRADIRGQWGLNDWTVALQRGFDMIEALDYPVDVIINALESSTPPLNLPALITRAVTSAPDRDFYVVVVGGHLTTRVAVETLGKVQHLEKKAVFVSTLDEARNLIALWRHKSVVQSTD